MKQKIFGIGLPKTGTSSLAQALGILGFKAIHNPANWRHSIYKTGKYDPPTKEWDAVCNFGEWTFPQLDELFPNSLFILTLRPKKDWLSSCEKWFCKSHNEMARVEIFGVSVFSRTRFSYVYDLHRKQVFDYFLSKPEKLLTLKFPLDWKPLCSFLGKDVPQKEFPWENKNRSVQ